MVHLKPKYPTKNISLTLIIFFGTKEASGTQSHRQNERPDSESTDLNMRVGPHLELQPRPPIRAGQEVKLPDQHKLRHKLLDMRRWKHNTAEWSFGAFHLISRCFFPRAVKIESFFFSSSWR